MSDRAQVLAFKVDGHSAQERAADVLAWLAGRGIIETLPTDSGLGALAHRPGPNALDAVVVAQEGGVFDFRNGRTNGMDVKCSMRVELCVGGDDMPGFRCPSCNTELDTDDVFPLVEDVANPFKAVPQIACGRCRKETPVDALHVDGGAFANLTLRFSNWWPLKPSFVKEVERACGAPAVVLHERL